MNTRKAIRYKALFDFDSRDINELTIRSGDLLYVFQGPPSDETKEWLRGEVATKRGICGYFPKSFAEDISSWWQKVEVIFDYDSMNETELTIRKGQVVTVRDILPDEEWWEGECNGRVGFFPVAYTTRYAVRVYFLSKFN
jgi:hypothetical protein